MPSITETRNSPNHFNGRAGWKVDMIGNHICEGTYAGSISWLCNTASGASSHFVVAKDGRICQLVSLTDGSWCNGTSTSGSNVDYRKSSLSIVKGRATNANYYTFSIEHEGYSGQAMPEAQYQATLWLHRYLISEAKRLYGVTIPIDREHIVGHYQINPITKPNCPGTGFPFDRLINDLRGADTEKANSFVGKHLKCLQNTTMCSNAGYDNPTTGTLNAGSVVYCEKLHNVRGLYMALKDADKRDFLPQAWTNSFNNFEITTYNPTIEVTDVSITNVSNELEVGEEMDLSVIVNPSNATNKTITFSSNDTNIAEVTNTGKITAKGIGTTTIKATANNGKVGLLEIKVYKEEEPTPVDPEPTEPETPVEPGPVIPDPVIPEEPGTPEKEKSIIYKIVSAIVNFIANTLKEVFKKK